VNGILAEIQDYIHEKLDSERYRHSLGVMEVSRKLAICHGEDPERAALAGILHDCGKHCSDADAIARLQAVGHAFNQVERFEPELLHGHIGAMIARERFHVTDPGILSAVACHTTGKTGMSLLDKIVYIADYIEPGREGDWVYPLRRVAYQDLDRCLVMCADSTMTFVMRKGKPIHPDTVHMRNEILMTVTRQGQEAE
jgi:predicted HD superfamily hydrolase involved in NAD metabolism